MVIKDSALHCYLTLAVLHKSIFSIFSSTCRSVRLCGEVSPFTGSTLSHSPPVMFCGSSRCCLQGALEGESHCCEHTVLAQGEMTPTSSRIFPLPALILSFKGHWMNQRCVKSHRKIHRLRALLPTSTVKRKYMQHTGWKKVSPVKLELFDINRH